MAKNDDSVLIKLRNLHPQILRFKFPNPDATRRNGLRKLHTNERLILGSSNDETLPAGVARGPRCPAPTAVISLADWRKLGRANQRSLLARAVNGQISIETDVAELPVDPDPRAAA